MFKPLSLSVSLAVALGACSLSFAGLGHHNNSVMASGQCETASPQSVIPSAQSIGEGCGSTCAPARKKCSLFSGLHKPKTYTYEWVLKKKRVWGHHNNAGCGTSGCESCGATYPSGQGYAAPQSYAAPQAFGAGQGYGSGQFLGASQIPATYSVPQGGLMPAPAPATGGDAAPAAPAAPAVEPPAAPATPAAPPAPTTPPTASTGGLQLLPAGN